MGYHGPGFQIFWIVKELQGRGSYKEPWLFQAKKMCCVCLSPSCFYRKRPSGCPAPIFNTRLLSLNNTGNCYPSVYIHTFPWKKKAKEKETETDKRKALLIFFFFFFANEGIRILDECQLLKRHLVCQLGNWEQNIYVVALIFKSVIKPRVRILICSPE